MVIRYRVFCLWLLGACELEPAPKVAAKQVPPPAPAAAPMPAPAPTPAPPPAPAQTVVEDDCTRAAVRYVNIQIAETQDAQLKSNLQLEKARTVLRIEKGCRDQKWSPEIVGCYNNAHTVADLAVCTKKLQPVPAPPPAKKDEPKKDEAKKDAAKKDEAKKDAAKKDAPKKKDASKKKDDKKSP